MNNFISKYIKKSGLRFMLLALPLGIAGAGSVASCSDWDDHYDGADSESSNISLWQQISSNPELSDFAEVLEQTKVFRQHKKSSMSYAEILNGGQSLTVMAPVNGTFNKDSLLALVQTANGDSAVEKNFVKNHLCRSPRSTGTDTLRMLNSKRVAMTDNDILGVSFKEKNIRCKNGVLHVLDQQIPYKYTVYEALSAIPHFSEVGNFIASYNEDVFDENASVSSGLVDGIPVYIDSVVYERNKIIAAVGLINSEDSTYFSIMPTNNGWKKAWDEAASHFKYPSSMEKGDSLQKYWATRSLLDDAFFSPSIQASMKDSVISQFYNKADPEYHVYYKPFESNGLFGAAKGMETCSNGFIYYYDEWPFTPEQTYFIKKEYEAEHHWNIISYNVCIYNAYSLNADSISKGGYLDIKPSKGTSNWKLTYKLANTLSGKYDFNVIILPKTIEDPDGNMRPCKFKATINYLDAEGKEQKYNCGGKVFISDPEHVDTICVAKAFELPACNYNQNNSSVSITIECSISSKENRNYNREMFLDCIFLSPVRESNEE